MSKSPPYLADFDSASAMVRALASHLHGEGFFGLGLPRALQPLAIAANKAPEAARQWIYAWSGWAEAASPKSVRQMKGEEVARWVVGSYPERRWPAVMVGSSNGALTHLAAALGIPWLPQTFLFALRHAHGDPDDPKESCEHARPLGEALLEANPDLQLHHMHDPNQDRLMVRHMTYFRVKMRRLGAAYRRFLEQTLEPGGTIFVVRCGCSWPVTRLGERYVFQMGGVGGPLSEEYLHGGPRVAAFLEAEGVERRAWDAPEPNEQAPEAEWGFAPELDSELAELARERGYRIVAIDFVQPEDASPLVADLYRWWYERHGLSADRLVVSSFVLIDPHTTLGRGAVPFWTKFPIETSAEVLERYLDDGRGFDEIGLMLFSHGVRSVGVAPIGRWREILARARKEGRFLGVDEDAYPADFAIFARYHDALAGLSERPAPAVPLRLDELGTFLEDAGSRYEVRWSS